MGKSPQWVRELLFVLPVYSPQIPPKALIYINPKNHASDYLIFPQFMKMVIKCFMIEGDIGGHGLAN